MSNTTDDFEKLLDDLGKDLTIDNSSFGTVTINSDGFFSAGSSINDTMLGSSLYANSNYGTFITNGTGTGIGISNPLTGSYITSSPIVNPDGSESYAMEIKGKLKVDGIDLTDAIKRIEERLNILHVNPELEEKWENLRELGRMYKELEAEILEKEKIYKILKK